MNLNPHADVGAYLLGALEDAEMTRFEEHLAECEECGTQLDELMGVVPVLEELRADGIGVVEPPGDALLQRLLAQVGGERRARGRRRLAAVAVAAVLVVGGPTIAVLATDDGGGGHTKTTATATFAADQHRGSDPATGASAVVGITDKGWGSMVDLRLSGVRGPLTCSLLAIGRNGAKQTVATWSVPYEGYGTDAHPRPLTVHGAAGLHKDDISHFEVQDSTGKLLVKVPV
ncbi:anti-sigma factor family protein [Streptomyces sp. NBC_01190]|uniref:anti-sigma factor family protein n=1 Tax=Streptomyces sp. NBC_01190 TaxID=2903767 RepID=UPI00386F0A22|nr:zf-HC2 domain-containing protein [Streptomyces sp. NBC_01190]